jgi:serine/threonine protein kinase
MRCGTVLGGKYLIGRSLGQGGFGITYTGWDLNLDLKVAVKEYYPEGYASRELTMQSTVLPFTGSGGDFFTNGREKFVDEAKVLAKFANLPGVVNVRDYFTANGTAYIVMEFLDGRTLKQIARERGKMPADEVLSLLEPIFSSLEKVHEVGLLPRAISPDNIIVSRSGGAKLLDFGAARQFSTRGENSNTINVKHGFAPEEQYRTRGEQGPWTDIYALCATNYSLTTGSLPPQALDRLAGEEISAPNSLGADFTESQQAALMRGLSVRGSERQQSVGELYRELYQGDARLKSPVLQTAFAASSAQPAPASPSSWVSPSSGGSASHPVSSTPAESTAPKGFAGILGNKKTAVIAAASSAAAVILIVVVLLVALNNGGRQDDVASVTPSPTAEATAAPTPTVTPTPAPVPTGVAAGSSMIALSTENLSMSSGETVDINVVVSNAPEEYYTLSYEIGDESVVSAAWGDWYEEDATILSLTCEGSGGTYVDISLLSEDETVTYETATLYVQCDAESLIDMDYLESMLLGYDAAVEIIDCTRGSYYSTGNSETPMAASALVNIPILFTTALYVDSGELAMSDGIMFNYTSAGRGGIPSSSSGTYVSVSDLLKNLMLYSDNNAANSLIDYFGFSTITDICYESGFESVDVSTYIGSGYDNYAATSDIAWMLYYLWSDELSIGQNFLLENMWIMDSYAYIGLGAYLPYECVFMNHNGVKDGVYSEAAIIQSGDETFIIAFIGNGGAYEDHAALAGSVGEYVYSCLG